MEVLPGVERSEEVGRSSARQRGRPTWLGSPGRKRRSSIRGRLTFSEKSEIGGPQWNKGVFTEFPVQTMD